MSIRNQKQRKHTVQQRRGKRPSLSLALLLLVSMMLSSLAAAYSAPACQMSADMPVQSPVFGDRAMSGQASTETHSSAIMTAEGMSGTHSDMNMDEMTDCADTALVSYVACATGAAAIPPSLILNTDFLTIKAPRNTVMRVSPLPAHLNDLIRPPKTNLV